MNVARIPAAFRVAHGQVLVAARDGRMLDLGGAAAAVWLAADEGCGVAELTERLDGTGLGDADIAETTAALLAAGLLRELDG